MLTVLKVLLPLPLDAFDFALSSGQFVPQAGARVLVPWQGSARQGIISTVSEGTLARDLHEVIAVLDQQPFLSEQGLQLITAVAEERCCPVGQVLANLLPFSLNQPLDHEIRRLSGVEDFGLGADWQRVEQFASSEVDFWRKQGLIEEHVVFARPKQRVLKAVKLVDEALESKGRANQRHALEVLWSSGQAASAAALSRLADVPESSVRALVKKGYARYETVDAPASSLPEVTPKPVTAGVTLASAANKQGVSGGRRLERLASLLDVLKEDLAKGGQVLVLAPELSHIDEVAGALAACFPLYVLTGELNDAQRHRVWQLLDEAPGVLLATYLGVLAPLSRLRRVVVLAEASSSYKLSFGCRPFVTRVAEQLAEICEADIVYSDSLLSPETIIKLESHHVVHEARRRIHVSDMTKTKNWPLSQDLIRVLKQVAERSRQAVVFAPRRGFSAAIQCSSCAWLATCPHCDVALSYHRAGYTLRCHQCNYRRSMPDACPQCQDVDLLPTKTAGTQWIAKAIADIVPMTTVYRFDSDERQDLSALYAGEPGVVVATSALLRQAALPNVSLIAVTLLDSVLNLADFRAGEKAFRLLLDVQELALGQRPLHLVQSFQAEHSVLTYLQQPDLLGAKEKFLNEILERRQGYAYPPFGLMAKLQLTARQKDSAERAAYWVKDAVSSQGGREDELLGPVPAPIPRVKGRYSFHVLLRAENRARLDHLMQPVLAYRGAARLRVDIDPRDIGLIME